MTPGATVDGWQLCCMWSSLYWQPPPLIIQIICAERTVQQWQKCAHCKLATCQIHPSLLTHTVTSWLDSKQHGTEQATGSCQYTELLVDTNCRGTDFIKGMPVSNCNIETKWCASAVSISTSLQKSYSPTALLNPTPQSFQFSDDIKTYVPLSNPKVQEN